MGDKITNPRIVDALRRLGYEDAVREDKEPCEYDDVAACGHLTEQEAQL